MKHVSSRIVACVGLLMFASPALALDNTVSNEFWCTWGYVNPTPTSGSSQEIGDFDSGVFSCVKSAVMGFFTSIPGGFMLWFR